MYQRNIKESTLSFIDCNILFHKGHVSYQQMF